MWHYFRENVEEDNSGFDSESLSTIKLNNQTILYLREINRHLAMVSILRTDSFERRGEDCMFVTDELFMNNDKCF